MSEPDEEIHFSNKPRVIAVNVVGEFWDLKFKENLF